MSNACFFLCKSLYCLLVEVIQSNTTYTFLIYAKLPKKKKNLKANSVLLLKEKYPLQFNQYGCTN